MKTTTPMTDCSFSSAGRSAAAVLSLPRIQTCLFAAPSVLCLLQSSSCSFVPLLLCVLYFLSPLYLSSVFPRLPHLPLVSFHTICFSPPSFSVCSLFVPSPHSASPPRIRRSFHLPLVRVKEDSGLLCCVRLLSTVSVAL